MKSISALLFVCLIAMGVAAQGRQLPTTVGESLSGKPVTLSNVIAGHKTVIVAGFSHASSDGVGEWVHELEADKALGGVQIYSIAELEHAPSFLRGLIKGGMRKGSSVAAQDRAVVLTSDDDKWRAYYGVGNEDEPYVVVLGPKGEVLWLGHGKAGELEPKVREALSK